MRPVEYFLSHQNEDRADVVDLEGAMRRRGLASWRDRKNLLVGDGSDEIIRAGIETETSGFVIFGSDRILPSTYVWEKEWPWAHGRHEREEADGHPAPYRLAPLLVDGLSHRKITAAAASRGQADPMTFNCVATRRVATQSPGPCCGLPSLIGLRCTRRPSRSASRRSRARTTSTRICSSTGRPSLPVRTWSGPWSSTPYLTSGASSPRSVGQSRSTSRLASFRRSSSDMPSRSPRGSR
jgi:hypothetical protein